MSSHQIQYGHGDAQALIQPAHAVAGLKSDYVDLSPADIASTRSAAKLLSLGTALLMFGATGTCEPPPLLPKRDAVGVLVFLPADPGAADARALDCGPTPAIGGTAQKLLSLCGAPA